MLNFNNGNFNTGGSDDGYIDLSSKISIDSNVYSRRILGSGEADRSFGSLGFNSPAVNIDIYQFNFGLEYFISAASLPMESDMQAMPGFDSDMDNIFISLESDMSVIISRDLSPTASFSIDTDMNAAAAYYEQSYLELLGSFAPGERIVIDAAKLTITKNGQNALHMLNGNFIELNLGPNQIEYSDDAAARNVLMRITHQDRYV